MGSIKYRQLINPTPEEVDAATSVWVKALYEVSCIALAGSPRFLRVWSLEIDTFDRSLVGGNLDYMHEFQRATLSAALVGEGEVWVAEDESGQKVGVAAWFGPNTGLMHTPEQGEAGFNALLGAYPEELRTWWTTYFLPEYEKITTETFGEGVKFAAWHLQQIGISPEWQGKGIGRDLIQAMETRPESKGKLFVLEVEDIKILPFYEKLGYVIDSKTEFKGSVSGLDFSMWLMHKQL